MPSPRRFANVQELEETWEAYKQECDHQMVMTHEFSQKNAVFVSQTLQKYATYTIEGFCVYAKLSRTQFYETYDGKEPFADVVTRMKEECEVDARKKFEIGAIPPQLAPLWMGHYGYSAKADNRIAGQLPVVIAGGDCLED